MAAEALGIGASVVTFVGVAGHIVQGCQYVPSILNDIDDAPDDILDMNASITLFESILLQLQAVLQQLDSSGVPVDHLSTVEVALKYGDDAVAALQKAAARIKNPNTRWCRIRVAFKNGKYAKYWDRLEKAKGFISVAQGGRLL
ncbi:hypothetical protein GLAREA_07609 [Glarea lozoyensis ATCC 20868]|uniref:Fungal N-terminal domain-containing protein n=1 Tax=Glarea lozoyensis (strain ATCC 20868 / MF5171) TaxID=1116229 RepID=S3DK90_GLAL2|nr:uncharacterized protein GLAREA_07609 [Glarea lozoyensis ATCC 20868]EPE32476.1 hypothetical protein GLAREA_07609 [Glarea lozoyensis ATCC 20868]